MTLDTTLDGNWHIRWHDLRKRTIYVKVYDGQIIDIEWPLTNWMDKPFAEFCRLWQDRHPETFEREQCCEPIEHQPVIKQAVTGWPGVTTIVLIPDNSDPLALSEDVARGCAKIQKTWSKGEELRRREGSSAVKPYEIHGTADLPRMPRGHRGFVADFEEDESLPIEDPTE